jgi:ubiquinone/menaquinone biosynthesis C-methylase UbiE
MPKTLVFALTYFLFSPLWLKAQHGNCKENYFNTLKRVEKMKPMFDFMDLTKGSVVASIGAKNGWFEAAASIYYDSLTFYLEDINADCLNETTVKKTVNQYEKLKKKPINNRFELVVGTDSTTGLPTQLFDRVLINNTYHHFSKKIEMLEDVKRIIKPDGYLYLFEPIILENQVKSFKCAYYTSETVLISEIEKAGFQFVERYEFGEGSLFFKFKNKKVDAN